MMKPWIAPHWLGLLFAVTLAAGGAPPVVEAQDFPPEPGGFTEFSPTIPNEALDFSTEEDESCCQRQSPTSSTGSEAETPTADITQPNVADANKAAEKTPVPSVVVGCRDFAGLTALASNTAPSVETADIRTYQILYSSGKFVSADPGTAFARSPYQKTTGLDDFHVAAVGGDSVVQIKQAQRFSVCMARGGNVALAQDTDNGSILTFNGNDRVTLTGNNTHLIARTGGGQDVIEIAQASALPGNQWKGNTLYRIAISGGADTDTVRIQGTPAGTKWCTIGGYSLFGEYFYVVEFALPPSVTEGPRRQRINIGRSVEFVEFKGRRYRLEEFLRHGLPTGGTVAVKFS